MISYIITLWPLVILERYFCKSPILHKRACSFIKLHKYPFYLHFKFLKVSHKSFTLTSIHFTLSNYKPILQTHELSHSLGTTPPPPMRRLWPAHRGPLGRPYKAAAPRPRSPHPAAAALASQTLATQARRRRSTTFRC
jgi:hypothetical protein